jgi:hypothetical protein
MLNVKENKENFIRIFTENITREGSKELLEWLEGSTFFTDPSAKAHHGNFDGGLCAHSLKVYYALKDFVQMYKHQFPDYEISEESIALVALLHDLCKVGLYKKGFRNVKNDNGVWEKIGCYDYDDKLGMGHGEGSVYIIQTFMKIARFEALSIRWHMSSWDSAVKGGDSSINVAREQNPLVTLICMADSWASQFKEETV